MARITRSARGVQVNFDLLLIKAQLENAANQGSSQELILQKSEDLAARRQKRRKRTKEGTATPVAPVTVDPDLPQDNNP